MIKFRDYQEILFNNIIDALKSGNKHLICYMAMRGGKTIVFSGIAQRMAKKGTKCLIVTERINLFDQTNKELSQFNLHPELIRDGTVYIDRKKSVFLAMPITLRNRMASSNLFKNWANDLDVIIIDEAHRSVFDWIFDDPFLSQKIILGFTGTPIRTGKQRQLSSMYQKIVYGPNTMDLEKTMINGRPVVNKLRLISIEKDNSDIRIMNDSSRGYEYNNASMFNSFNKPELYHNVVQVYSDNVPNTMAICYNINIIHAIKTCIAFNDAGIKSKFITSAKNKPKLKDNPTDGDIVRYERHVEEYNLWEKYYQVYSGDEKKILDEWRSGQFYVLQNVDKYTFGFNEAKLITVIVNKATMSIPLWVQMSNRSTTMCVGKLESWCIDMAGNYAHLLAPNFPHQWSLTHEVKENKAAQPIKECGSTGKKDQNGRIGCGYYCPVSLEICPECGYIFTSERKEKIGLFKEIDYIDSHFPQKNNQNDEFKKLERIAEERSYRQGWVIPQIIAKHGEQGLIDYAEYRKKLEPDKFGNGWIWQTKKRFQNLIDRYNENQKESI